MEIKLYILILQEKMFKYYFSVIWIIRVKKKLVFNCLQGVYVCYYSSLKNKISQIQVFFI